MATPNSVDKGLYQAPLGVVESIEEPIEIEIILDGVAGNELEIDTSEKNEEEKDFYRNLATELDSTVLQTVVTNLQTLVKDDLRTRVDWEKMLAEGINLMGLKYEIKTEPWQGACGVFHPMITEAVIRFQADTIMETFPSAGPVKTHILGRITENKEKAAKRVEDDMNWQLMDNMPEFRPDHERLMWNLPGAGAGFKKVYRCPILKRPTSVFVPAEDVIIPYGATDLLTSERITHRMKYTKQDVMKIQESGFWCDTVLPSEPQALAPERIQQKKDKEMGQTPVFDNRFTIYECSVDLDLEALSNKDEPGVGKPYIVTFIDQDNTALAIRRNWKKDDAAQLKRLHFVQYTYIPGYGAYGFGLFHTLGGFAQSATSIIRQLVDAGTLSNIPGGLKSKGLRIKGDDEPIAPGEFRDVDVGSGTIRDNIMPLPYKEPSATLYNLMVNIVEEARRFAATNDLKVADMSSQAPVGTTLAVLERQLRTMTAVQARVHFSFKQELRLLAELFKEDAEDGDEYAVDVDAPEGRKAKLKDYSYVSIIPVSDPNAATMSQRVVQYQAAIQLAQMAPQIYDQPELHRQMLTVLGIKNVNKLVPTEDDIKIVDPAQENQNILVGKPVKAYAWQNHEAHIRVHVAMARDPIVQELIGQNPQASKIMASGQAHIAEHVGYAYRNRLAQTMNIQLPAYGNDDSLPQDVEIKLSQMMAQAAPQVLQISQQIASQQQAQRNAQDPVLQAQVIEQQNTKAEIDRKSKRDFDDIQIAQAKLRIEAQSKGVDPERMMADLQLERDKANAQMQLDTAKFSYQQEKDAAQMGMQAVKDKAAFQTQQAQATQQVRATILRNNLEIESKRAQVAHAAERHRQELALAKELHNANLESKRKIAAVAAKTVNPPPSESKK